VAEKTVSTRLVANNQQYDRAMLASGTATQRVGAAGRLMGAEIKKAGGQVTGIASGIRRDISQASDESLRTIGHAGLIAGGLLAGGLALAMKTTMDFDKQLSDLQAVTGETAESMGDLRDQAIEAGAATVFSASEAATAQVELAKAGVGTADILGGALTGALNLASAGNLQLGRAAEIAAANMTTFKLSGADVPRIADALAAGANKSAAGVEDMAQGMQQAGLVAAQMDLSLEETTGLLAMFAQNGLRGSDAGTSLKTMLMRLTPEMEKQKGLMADLGLEFYDAEGNFVGISDAAQQLHDKLKPLTQEQRQLALQTLFGQDAIRGATILYQQGAAGVDEWTSAVSETGYAAELAAVKTDNLAGDLEALRGSIETAVIQGGSEATDVLRGLTQGATNLVNGIGTLPEPVFTAGVGITAITTAGLGTIGMIGTFAPKIREAKKALDGLGASGQFVSSHLGTVGKAAGIAGAALAAVMWAAADAGGSVARANEQLQDFYKGLRTGDDLGGMTMNLSAMRDEFARLDAIVRESSTWDQVFEVVNIWAEDTVSESSAAMDQIEKDYFELAKKLQQRQDVVLGLMSAYSLTADEAERLLDASAVPIDTLPLDAATQAVGAYYAASQDGTAGQQDLAASSEVLGDKVASVEERFDAMVDAIESYLGMLYGTLSAEDQFQKHLNDLTESYEGNTEKLNENTEAGAEFRRHIEETGGLLEGTSNEAIGFREGLRGLVSESGNLIEAWVKEGVQGAELTARIDGISQAFRDQALAAGIPAEVVEAYIADMYRIPENVDTAIMQTGMPEAQAATGILQTQLADVRMGAHGVVTVDTTSARIALDSLIEKKLAIGTPVVVNGQSYDYLGPGLARAEPRAAGGPLSPWSVYRVHDTSQPEFMRLQDGTTAMFTGSSGGHVTPLSKLPGGQLSPVGGGGQVGGGQVDYAQMEAAFTRAVQRMTLDVNIDGRSAGSALIRSGLDRQLAFSTGGRPS
jgi:TP901 family phage tail tape measure protein